jgi:hypothetical protein
MSSGHLLGHAGQQLEVEPRLEFGEEALGGPAFFQEEVLDAGAVAAFAQALLVAEDFGDGANDADGLIGQDEGVEANGEMGLVGEAAADAQRVADFAVVLHGGEANVVDLRIAAPGRAAGDGDFELARQVVELGLPVSSCAISRASGEASMISSAATPASGQPVTLRTTSPQAPLGERPMALSASTTSGSDSMVSQ